MSDSLGEALPREMARVRDVVIPVYLERATCQFSAALMRADLDLAAKSIIEGDIVAMVRIYKKLKEWRL